MTPEPGDDVANLLDPPHDAEVRRWTEKTGRKLVYGGWQDRGNTTARLIAAFIGRRTEQKVILKYAPKGRRETEEFDRHADAWDQSPDDFRQRHLVRQPFDPIMLPSGGWILFQEIANHDLSTIRPMSSLLAAAATAGASLSERIATAVGSVLGEWNANHDRSEFVSTGEHLDELLGDRLRRGHPLRDWAYSRGLVTGVRSAPTEAEVNGLPNPFTLVLGPHSTRDRRVYVTRGRAHGDLHPGNIVLGPEPDQFWLVDLARFDKSAPLTFDPAYLALTIAAHFLPVVPESMRPAAINLMLDPKETASSWLPQLFCEVIPAIRGAAESWAGENSRSQEWRAATLLAFVAGGLIMCGREIIPDADREWFLRLAAAAASRYVALQDPAGPALDRSTTSGLGSGRPAPGQDGRHIVAPDRASLRAQTLPQMSRGRLLDLAMTRRRQQAEISSTNQALVLTGEGGIGKSVLLGQLLERIEAAGDQAVVLVPCGNVTPGAPPTDLPSIDAALGVAADQQRGRGGLLRLLAAMRETYGSVVLLLDTVDLVLGEESANPVAALITEVLGVGEVVMTCRTQEFNDYLLAVPRLAGRLSTFPVPVLGESEIVDWAARYLQNQTSQRDHSSFLESLAGGISSSGSLRQVCSLPVRLALACQTFADEGHLPEDLSVTGLYQAYWEARVRRHAGQAATAGEAKENAALQLASRVITPSGRIVLRVAKGIVPHEHRNGLRSLASEGVLRESAVDWEFFHQTFAEFAHARWLLTHGVESPELDELIRRATSSRANLWPVLGSVLLQITDYDDYRIVADRLPMTSADAAQTRVLGALQRREPNALVQVLTELTDQVELLPVALALLGQAPAWHVPVAFEGALEALRRHPEVLASASIDALVPLLARDATGADLVRRAVLAMSSQKRALSETKRESFLERLVRPFTTQPTTSEKLAVLRETYPSLGPLGRREAIRAHLRHAGSDDERVAIARTAVQHQCPPFSDTELVEVLGVLWNNPAERDRFGWSTWRELLADTLPREWDNAQLKLVVHLANESEELAGELVDELLRGEVRSTERHVNAFTQIVAGRVGWTVDRLLSGNIPAGRVAVNGVSKCAHMFAAHLDRTDRLRLIDWLRPARATNPRTAWPTHAVLAAGDIDLHRTVLAELRDTDPAPAVQIGVARVEFGHAPLAVLTELADDLRALVRRIGEFGTATASEVLAVRARLEGRLAETDQRARDWIDEQLGAGASPAVARTVARTIADAHPDGPPQSMLVWLGRLLSTPHTDAAERLATMLHDAVTRPDGMPPAALIDLTSTMIDRMRTAVDRQEDSRLHRRLLNLLIQADEVHPLSERSVRDIYQIVRVRLLPAAGRSSGAAVSDYPAAIRDLSTLSGTLMSKRLDAETVRDMIAEALTDFDPDRLGSKIRTAVTSLLISLTGRDSEAADWLTVLFGMPGISLEVQLSIADALLQFEARMPGGRATAIKDRPDCPGEVAALIVSKLQT